MEAYLEIPRAVSAPPVMDTFSSKNLFSFRQDYFSLAFGDIRLEQNYDSFYRSYDGPEKFPPPLESTPFTFFAEHSPVNRASSVASFQQQQHQLQQQQHQLQHAASADIVPPALRNHVIHNTAPRTSHPSEDHLPYGSNAHASEVSSDIWAPLPRKMSNLSLNETAASSNPQTIQNQSQIRTASDLERNTPSPWNPAGPVNSVPPTSSYSPENPILNQLMSSMQPPTVVLQQQQQLQQLQQQLREQQLKQQYMQQQLQQQQALLQVQADFRRSSPEPSVTTVPPNRALPPKIYTTAVVESAPAAPPSQPSPQAVPAQNERREKGVPARANDRSRSSSPERENDHYRDRNDRSNRKNTVETSPATKYTNMEEVIGRIDTLAKDQYGCRFLQRKLDEGVSADIDAIFSEVFDSIVDLMTDPFGNYLCQKLVEHCTDEQKSAIISKVSPELINISLNMHGTRAVQKLIECLNNPAQVRMVVDALKSSVVTLIKDLNGNHVIQRCLNHLSETDRQFIYDAVAGRCVDVATHRHGCCVLQRCVDYASRAQKMQLVNKIISNCLTLVQDPFGNYVVQYILDLGVEQINIDIMTQFFGHVPDLSQNKFSSNVIEKCLRLAPPETRGKMIVELLNSDQLQQLLQDSYANYVIQTAMSVSDTALFNMWGDRIRPMLHLIRNTPYGKKIENKLAKRPTSGSFTAQTGSAPIGSAERIGSGGGGAGGGSGSRSGNRGGKGSGYSSRR